MEAAWAAVATAAAWAVAAWAVAPMSAGWEAVAWVPQGISEEVPSAVASGAGWAAEAQVGAAHGASSAQALCQVGVQPLLRLASVLWARGSEPAQVFAARGPPSAWGRVRASVAFEARPVSAAYMACAANEVFAAVVCATDIATIIAFAADLAAWDCGGTCDARLIAGCTTSAIGGTIIDKVGRRDAAQSSSDTRRLLDTPISSL